MTSQFQFSIQKVKRIFFFLSQFDFDFNTKRTKIRNIEQEEKKIRNKNYN